MATKVKAKSKSVTAKSAKTSKKKTVKVAKPRKLKAAPKSRKVLRAKRKSKLEFATKPSPPKNPIRTDASVPKKFKKSMWHSKFEMDQAKPHNWGHAPKILSPHGVGVN